MYILIIINDHLNSNELINLWPSSNFWQPKSIILAFIHVHTGVYILEMG